MQKQCDFYGFFGDLLRADFMNCQLYLRVIGDVLDHLRLIFFLFIRIRIRQITICNAFPPDSKVHQSVAYIDFSQSLSFNKVPST